jgi:uncharacterized protein
MGNHHLALAGLVLAKRALDLENTMNSQAVDNVREIYTKHLATAFDVPERQALLSLSRGHVYACIHANT